MVFKKGQVAHSKLSWSDVHAIRALRQQLFTEGHKRVSDKADTRGLDALAKQYGVSRTTISHIVTGKSWKEHEETPAPTPTDTVSPEAPVDAFAGAGPGQEAS